MFLITLSPFSLFLHNTNKCSWDVALREIREERKYPMLEQYHHELQKKNLEERCKKIMCKFKFMDEQKQNRGKEHV